MTAPRFFTDEDLYASVAPALRKHGFDATSIYVSSNAGQSFIGARHKQSTTINAATTDKARSTIPSSPRLQPWQTTTVASLEQ